MFVESSKNTPNNQLKTVLVDIDETISYYANKRRYDLALPKKENIDKINALYDSGQWKIIYWTARGSVSGNDYYDFTWDQLLSWGCRFHDLICGKQKGHFDLLIDDKAITIEMLNITNTHKDKVNIKCPYCGR